MNTWDRRKCCAAGKYTPLLLALFALMALPGSSLPAYGQAPANDNFDKATPIASLPFIDRAASEGATAESGEPSCCCPQPNTVWYSLLPAVDTWVRADMSGSGFSDTVLSVFEDIQPSSGLSGLLTLDCGSFGNSVTFHALAGKKYYFRTGSCSGSPGTLQLNLYELVPPANDDFALATEITALPFHDYPDTGAASVEKNEPTPDCVTSAYKTIWYAFTPTMSGSISAQVDGSFYSFVAAYKYDRSMGLTKIDCRVAYSTILTIRVEKDLIYYFQVGGSYPPQQGPLAFKLDIAPPPVANFGMYPWDPSIFDAIQFNDYSFDPAQVGIQSQSWNFGDGATATGNYPTHRYNADGDYTIGLTVSTPDGRTASTSQLVQVRTHDVAITKFVTPSAASAGQTRAITVGINSRRYPEDVTVLLLKSIPGYGSQTLGSLTQSVPVRSARRTTDFNFSYTFTRDDARIGKVVFKAIAQIGPRDALAGDNEATAFPTKVSR